MQEGSFQSAYAAGNLTGVPNSISRPGGLSTVIGRYGAGAGANALRLQSLEHRNANASVWQGHGYEYNLEGEITKWTQPRRQWALTHDATGQLKGLIEKETASGEVKAKQDWQYDAAGNQIGSTTHQRTLTTPAVRRKVETRAVTGRNQLTGLTATPGSSLIEGTVNELSNVTVNGQAAPLAFSAAAPYGFQKELNLPPGDQVITIQSTDGSANSAQKSYTLTVRGDYALAYDVNGNLFTKTWRQAGNPGVDWVKETYTWDKENRLTGWTKERLLVTGVQTAAVLASATWTYDGLGRRVKEQNVVGAAVTDTHFVWDGMAMVQWQSAAGVAQRNLFDEGEHNVVTGEKLIYVKDHLGSVRGWHRLSDGARGEADFSAWGVRSAVSNTTGSVPVRSFTGHYQHAASGLDLALYRAYDPELGRWLSEDPIGEQGGVNLYGYAYNAPDRFIDPLGLDVWVEGPSGNEPAGHQSINVGDPNGNYSSYSFGCNFKFSLKQGGLQGVVYEDTEQGGQIDSSRYLKTDRVADRVVDDILNRRVGKTNGYTPDNTCRNFSQNKFDQIAKILTGNGAGKLTTPPERTNPPYSTPGFTPSTRSTSRPTTEPTTGTTGPTSGS